MSGQHQDSNSLMAISIERLNVFYRGHHAVRHVDLNIPKGVLIGIGGPNGAGKSSLIKAVCDMVPSTGRVRFFGEKYKKFRKKIAFVPQRTAVEWDFPITAFEVVLMGAYPRTGCFLRPSIEHKQEAFYWMKKLGIDQLKDKSIGELSGGQQQRIFVARALMQQAEVLFFDEPFSGIDALSETQIMSLFRSMRDQGKTLLVIHHTIQSWSQYFDWMILLNKTLIASGPTASVLTKENLRATYPEAPDILTADYIAGS